jgi:murein DD-endopeptidase MepM/ murein hydrolase activator NlpD
MKINVMKRILSLTLSAVLVLSAVTFSGVYASDLSSEDQQKVNELRQKKEDLGKLIEQNQASIDKLKEEMAPVEAYAAELSAQIGNYQQQIDVLLEEIDGLEQQKAVHEKQIDELNKDIGKVEDDITENEIQTAEVREEINEVYTKFKERLCEIYVNGSTSDLELLLDCDDVNDFSTYLIMIEISQRRARNDEKMIDDLHQDIAKIDELTTQYNAMIADLEVKKQEQQTQIDALNVSEQAIETDKSSLEASQSELETLKEEAFSQLAELDKKSDAAASLISQYEDEQAELEKEIDTLINSRASKSANVVVNPGGFIWPLQYSDVYISSPFGYRYDPISGVYKLHGGTDTCCSSGTAGKEVVASAAGTVIIAEYMSGGYGNYVAIDHGNGIVTLYAHNSSLNVSEGQTVNQGDVIAYAGSSGYATGAHCHFEVRVNGTKVEPTAYASP